MTILKYGRWIVIKGKKYKCGDYVETQKTYYQKHKSIILKNSREYFKTSNGIYASLKFRLKRRNQLNKLKISKKDFIEWFNQQEQKCFYCGRTIEETFKDNIIYSKNFNRFTIDRIDSNKGYELENIVLACFKCNMIKGNIFTKDEMFKIIKLFPYKWHLNKQNV